MDKNGFKAKDSFAADNKSNPYTVKGTSGDKSSREMSEVVHEMSPIEPLSFEVS